jgi:hypothetical protein
VQAQNRYRRRESGRSEYMQGTMVKIVLFVMVIGSTASLLVVSPRKARRKLLRALRQYEDGGTGTRF